MRKVMLVVALVSSSMWSLAACSDDGGAGGPGNVDASAPDVNAPESDASSSDAPVTTDAGKDAEPPGPNALVKVVAGGYHSCALYGSGKLWCWGNNMAGQLGLGTVDSDVHFKAAMVPGVTNAVDVAVGRYHTCVVDAASKVRCWGLNAYRQLGVDNTGDTACSVFGGSFTCRLAAVDVPLTGTVKKLALGFTHSCALVTEAGQDKVLCWGANDAGQLGHDPAGDDTCPYGSTKCKATPMEVALTGPTDVTLGYTYSAAVVAGGEVKAWGGNFYGQHGTGTADMGVHPAPVTVASVQASALVPMAGSGEHVCAKTTASKLTCWGRNTEGQSGLSPFATTIAPNALGFTVSEAGLGGRHTCYLAADKTVSCFGDDSSGELGRDPGDAGSATSEPGQVFNLTDARAVAVGGYFGCAVKTDDSVWCWGRNTNGEAGRDPMAGGPSYAPTKVTGLNEIGD